MHVLGSEGDRKATIEVREEPLAGMAERELPSVWRQGPSPKTVSLNGAED